jgi:outer membrane receptor protein involved in Fe transport
MFLLNIEDENLFDIASMTYSGSIRKYDDYVGTSSGWSRSDGSDMFRTWLINDFQRKRTTHELRFGSIDEDSNLDWTVGYFFDKDEDSGNGIQHQYHGDGNEGKAIASAFWGDYWSYFGGECEAEDGTLQTINNVAELGMMYWNNPDINYSEETTISYAQEQSLFGEASYTFELGSIGELEVTAGIRFYELKDREAAIIKGIWGSTSDADNRPDLPAGTPYVGTPDVSGEESGNRKKFSVSWRPDEEMSVYALYSEGYRPGGNNIATLPQGCRNDPNAGDYSPRYESDAIDNYEVGYKASLFNNTMSISTAVYQIDWTQAQVEIDMGCGFSYTANAGAARTRGIELETMTNLTDDLTFTFNAGYVDGEILEDVESIGAEAGDSMTQVPDYNVYMALDQGFQAFNRQAYVRLDVEAYGEYKSNFAAADGDVIPSYEQVNLSSRIELSDGVTASVHFNNLFDKEIINWKSSTGNEYGNYHYVEYANGRNVTARLDFTF